MPWKIVWEDAPKDMSLRVWKTEEIPINFRRDFKEPFDRFREISDDIDGEWRHWYECRYCGGWIEGSPNAFSVNTMDSRSLSGRSGIEYHCIRCGEQIAFLGMMS